MSIESVVSQESLPVTPIYTLPPIAGFWRRLGAWVLDMLLLVVIGQILGWVLFSALVQIGPYGRLIGLLLTLTYFGLLNSRIGGGQTLGKRLLKIVVRDGQNKPIGIGRSMVRALILAAPALFNGWSLPILQAAVLQWVAAVIAIGGGLAILYTMIFNHSARQGLHDLICGTYVVHPGGSPVEAFPRTSRVHFIVSGILIGLVATGAAIGGFVRPFVISATGLAPVCGLYEKLQSDGRFFTVGVNDATFYGNQGKTTRSLRIWVWYKGAISNDDMTAVISEIAGVALTNTENISEYDSMTIAVATAYDLGFASGHSTGSDSNPIAVWQERINPDPLKNR